MVAATMRTPTRNHVNAAPVELSGLVLLPLAGALLGALVEEHEHLGFTTWRSVCSATGYSFISMVTFAFELLPLAVIGMLAGGIAVQAIAFAPGRRAGHMQRCVAAHAACGLSMPAGFFLCALALPVPLMLLADALISLAVASLIYGYGAA